jgi:HupE/UreJ protein
VTGQVRLLAIAALAAVAIAGQAGPAAAHPTLASAVLLDVGADAIDAELDLPLDQLQAAMEVESLPLPASAPRIRAYVAAHLGAATLPAQTEPGSGDGGAGYAVEVGEVSARSIDGAPHAVVQVRLTPPAGASTDSFRLRDDVILARVVSHKIYVSLRRDFRRGRIEGGEASSGKPDILGVIRYQHDALDVDRGGSWWRGAAAVARLGVNHIAEGSDHLLFLLVLLLPAPLVLARRAWSGPAPIRRALREVVAITAAFTVGHSLTLALGAVGAVQLPGPPVEIAIAASIAVSAVHAVRPLFAGGIGRGAAIAAGFGLIHGLAFATSLADLGLRGRELGLALLGFNLGIEAMQLAVVAMVIPWLLLLARTPLYRPLRLGGAGVGGLAAFGWIGERAFGIASPVGPAVDAAFRHPAWVIAPLAATALLATAAAQLRGGWYLRRA